MDWKQYQEEVAQFFRSLGCEADVNAEVEGARARHKLDVWVRFKKFGLQTAWVIECKYWRTAVSKEKVLALQAVVNDIGADRGILVSTAGFQSGAVRASEKTNITLTDLELLKETSREDLIASVLHTLEMRATELRYALLDLYSDVASPDPHARTYKIRDGVDGEAVIRTIGALSFIDSGFDQIRVKKTPFPIWPGRSGQIIVAKTLDEFVARASEVIEEAAAVLNEQKSRIDSARKSSP